MEMNDSLVLQKVNVFLTTHAVFRAHLCGGQ